MTIEKLFNVPLIASLALREKQIQQNDRPVIGVLKWFARRPGTLFRGLLLAEFGRRSVEETFYRSNDLSGIRVADPFMGGGTPLIEANRVGCDVVGLDVNPMAAWIVREKIEGIDLVAYHQAAQQMLGGLEEDVGEYYRTVCPLYGDADVPVKSFLWVKTLVCADCGTDVDLFPRFLVARNVRHPRHVLVCPDCGDLNEVVDEKRLGVCRTCDGALRLDGPARDGQCACPRCGHVNVYPGAPKRPLAHRLFAIEYHNPKRKAGHRGRFFKKPDVDDLARFDGATTQYDSLDTRFVPDDAIPAGDETSLLHRWGYGRYRELFNSRQLLGLEMSCRRISCVEDERLRLALATNLSDLLRRQNMMCRYDTTALRALDVFSVHGFPVGLIQCESNLLGIANAGTSNVSSGSWANMVQKYVKAKAYCERPYEVRHNGSRNKRVMVPGERIGIGPGKRRRVSIHCASATETDLEPESVDAVLTDPPYFGNVQYAELMDFCYVWLRRLAGTASAGFDRPSTRSTCELTGNNTAPGGIEEFAQGLSDVYRRMAVALKPGAPLAFTYQHNKVDAYAAVGVAILDAGLVCTAALPCPAEMGGSIHIHVTPTSIIDTVFVCRQRATGSTATADDSRDALIAAVTEDVAALTHAGRRPTRGDVRCILLGHATRVAVDNLRDQWNADAATSHKLDELRNVIRGFGDLGGIVPESRGRAEGLMRAKESDLDTQPTSEGQLAPPV